MADASRQGVDPAQAGKARKVVVIGVHHCLALDGEHGEAGRLAEGPRITYTQALLDAGASAFVQKPFRMADFGPVIRSLFIQAAEVR